MKSHRKTLTFQTPERMAFVNITPDVEAAVRESGVREDRLGLHQRRRARFARGLQRYHHNRTGEDNGDAHHKRQVMGREVVVAITEGKLDFGPWERIFYGEFDGKRPKRVLIKIIGD